MTLILKLEAAFQNGHKQRREIPSFRGIYYQIQEEKVTTTAEYVELFSYSQFYMKNNTLFC